MNKHEKIFLILIGILVVILTIFILTKTSNNNPQYISTNPTKTCYFLVYGKKEDDKIGFCIEENPIIYYDNMDMIEV